MSDNVYVQSNEADGNRVLAFRRSADEMFTQLGSFSTGGTGTGTPHLNSQGSVVLTGDGRHLLVTNAGSGDLSVFATVEDGLTLLQTIPTGGGAPKSATEHGGLVYVLNTEGPSLSDGAVSRYALSADGSLSLDDATAGIAIEGETGLRDEDLSGDGRSLYVVNADSQRIFGWAVGNDGTLSPLGAWDGLPESVAGLAAS